MGCLVASLPTTVVRLHYLGLPRTCSILVPVGKRIRAIFTIRGQVYTGMSGELAGSEWEGTETKVQKDSVESWREYILEGNLRPAPEGDRSM